MRIAFLFSFFGGTQSAHIKSRNKKNKTKHQFINPYHQSINRYQKRRKRKSLMQLCKKNVYDLWRESEILPIFAYTTLF